MQYSFISATAERCTQYNDVFGWVTDGFECPRWYDSWDDTYCCGSNSYKYCCSESWLAIDDQDYSWVDWGNGLDDAVGAAVLG